jgi:hypothetical protein
VRRQLIQQLSLLFGLRGFVPEQAVEKTGLMAKWLIADGKTGAFQPWSISHLPCQIRFSAYCCGPVPRTQ